MLKALRRHQWRPAHLYFVIEAPGDERLITRVVRDGYKYPDSGGAQHLNAASDGLIGEIPERLHMKFGAT
jgi:protocatechuate 3,4-dioxygenase beta subunit